MSDSDLKEILNVLGPKPGIKIAVLVVIAVIFLVVLFLLSRIGKKDKKEAALKELQYYSDNMFNWAKPAAPKSGNIYMVGNTLYYSRGQKNIPVDIFIEKETVLTPDMISEWFKDRNDSQREEEKILNDIKNYLLENRMCKSVVISDNEEQNSDNESDIS